MRQATMPKSRFSLLLTTVKLAAAPSKGMDTGYIPFRRAPFQYLFSRGPGTLEITVLNGGKRLP